MLLSLWGGVLFDLIAERLAGYYPGIVYKLLECNALTFIWIFAFGISIYYSSEIVIRKLVDLRWLFLVIYIIWQYFIPDDITGLFNGIRYNIVTTSLMLFFVTGFGFSYRYRVKEDFSYSFYLYHMVVINAVVEFVGNKFSTYQNIICFILIFGIISVLAIFSRRMIADRVGKLQSLAKG